ncbi:MAG: hypothetical protein HUK40_04405 [Desulfobacter sp.]|nr:hypothetical protein [Desulfobacter sp.]WDP87564.1 MAG: hypothetical protein HUN05_22560 [Desulfobacter sp.]
MELLIIKIGDHYLRVKPQGFFKVGLDKASVFPMKNLAQVKTLANEAETKGFKNIVIKKLVLTEEDLP